MSFVYLWLRNLALVSFLVCSLLLIVIKWESTKRKDIYKNIEQEQNSSFGTIQEVSKFKNHFPISYQCQYSFSLVDGTLLEAQEKVPFDIYKRLRHGDTIEIYIHETNLFGKPGAITKIKGNPIPDESLRFPELYFKIGTLFFALMFVLCQSIMVWEWLSRTYPFLQKPAESASPAEGKIQDSHQNS